MQAVQGARAAGSGAALGVCGEAGPLRVESRGRAVVFEGIALGPGVYVDAAGRKVRVRSEHLGLVAQRMRGVFLRDLHREDLGASVGVVASARVEGGEVRFTGDVRLAPYVEIVRQFAGHIRFSLGFRYDAANLVANGDGTYDLPEDFVVDHLALVPQGQYTNARLVRLLNQARGFSTDLTRGTTMADDPATDKDELSGDNVVVVGAASPQASRCEGADQGAAGMGGKGGGAGADLAAASAGTAAAAGQRQADELRRQRDEALRAADRGKAELAEARSQLARTRADLEAAGKLVQAARLELGQAKNRVAAEVMKLELGAGRDFDLDLRKQELVAMELAALDGLRGELRLAAEKAAPEPTTADVRGASAKGGQGADLAARPGQGAGGSGVAGGLELEGLGLPDALRLAFQQGVL